ncbi:hypothetical protein [Nonomuraea dietziae]|uniref:hypothetical protein n=1 Tax=Nonomuraea dietziae TaxID=65515 RepID=UPI0031CDF7B3
MNLTAAGPPSLPAPDGDHEVHGDEHDLEEHEEQQQVEREERAEHADFEDEQREHQSPCAVRQMAGAPAEVDEAEEGQQRGQHDQREGDAVDPEVEAQAERGNPRHVDGELEARGLAVLEEHREQHRQRQGEPRHQQADEPEAARGGGHEQQRGAEQRHRQQRDRQPGHPNTTAPTAISSTPASRPLT